MYGNATQTIANDPDDWHDLNRLVRIAFYPDDYVNFEDHMETLSDDRFCARSHLSYPIIPSSRAPFQNGGRNHGVQHVTLDGRSAKISYETILWKPAIASVVPIVWSFFETTGTIRTSQTIIWKPGFKSINFAPLKNTSSTAFCRLWAVSTQKQFISYTRWWAPVKINVSRFIFFMTRRNVKIYHAKRL